MPMVWLYTLVSVVLVSLLSLIGVLFISLDDQRLRRLVFLLVSLAVGALFGDVFIHLLPETFASAKGMAPSLAVLGGIFLFFILEKFLHWRHQHLTDSGSSVRPLGYMNLVANGLHNLLDGLMIGAAYLVSLPVGLATSTAVVLHEIPHEIGDFGILIHAGFSRRRALLFNFLSACLAIVGALAALLIGGRMAEFSRLMIPLTAGGFIYIAGSDLLPELHEESKPSQSLAQLLAILCGVCLMMLLRLWD